ncbi:hypothetical protein A9P82_01020 [Arachidicoccus ginsenosidimutans]|uniref:OmpH family outer membrane protein n=1 Tax=Arachidicoccus sp. BS20 TaxID=1850526 RepID=UPI0007F1191A|nr:OmpH family outer membrane protein [Arachidicoccus sp. BS20]ANI88025.1 hypothetical protein A9P82_01020 [Arachidicoccus sp. BS20]
MNKYLISSNVVLIIAVIVLFCLHFSKKEQPAQTPAIAANGTAGAQSNFKFGYFELDSLDNNYKYEQDVKDELVAKDNQIEKQINNLQNEVRDKYNELQKKGPTLSQAEQVQYTNELNELGQQNQTKAENLRKSFGMESDAKLQQVKKRIQNYLKIYAKEKGYKYIIGTSEADPSFYFKDSTQDITEELLRNLNQQYTDSLKNVKK